MSNLLTKSLSIALAHLRSSSFGLRLQLRHVFTKTSPALNRTCVTVACAYLLAMPGSSVSMSPNVVEVDREEVLCCNPECCLATTPCYNPVGFCPSRAAPEDGPPRQMLREDVNNCRRVICFKGIAATITACTCGCVTSGILGSGNAALLACFGLPFGALGVGTAGALIYLGPPKIAERYLADAARNEHTPQERNWAIADLACLQCLLACTKYCGLLCDGHTSLDCQDGDFCEMEAYAARRDLQKKCEQEWRRLARTAKVNNPAQPPALTAQYVVPNVAYTTPATTASMV